LRLRTTTQHLKASPTEVLTHSRARICALSRRQTCRSRVRAISTERVLRSALHRRRRSAPDRHVWQREGQDWPGPERRGSGPTSTSNPSLDVLSEPEANSALAEVYNRPWKVCIPPEVRRDAVVVRETQHRRDLGGPNEVFRIDPRRHHRSLGKLTVSGARL
jgi:hypothetical protein